jgi:Lar family restriction alleviation protein
MHKPCPFCGDRDIRFLNTERSHPNDRDNSWRVECGSCPCELRWFSSKEQALEYWNKRTSSQSDTRAELSGASNDRGREHGRD